MQGEPLYMVIYVMPLFSFAFWARGETSFCMRFFVSAYRINREVRVEARARELLPPVRRARVAFL